MLDLCFHYTDRQTIYQCIHHEYGSFYYMTRWLLVMDISLFVAVNKVMICYSLLLLPWNLLLATCCASAASGNHHSERVESL